MTKLQKLFASAGVCLACVGLVAGCSTPHGHASATSQETGASAMNLPAPIAIDAANAQGKTIEIPVGNSAYIVVPSGTEPLWSGTVADSHIALFSPGSIKDGLVLRPGLKALANGTTTVTMTRSDTGTTIDFTIHVS